MASVVARWCRCVQRIWNRSRNVFLYVLLSRYVERNRRRGAVKLHRVLLCLQVLMEHTGKRPHRCVRLLLREAVQAPRLCVHDRLVELWW